MVTEINAYAEQLGIVQTRAASDDFSVSAPKADRISPSLQVIGHICFQRGNLPFQLSILFFKSSMEELTLVRLFSISVLYDFRLARRASLPPLASWALIASTAV